MVRSASLFCLTVWLLGSTASAIAAQAGGGPDPFDTRRYLPVAPGSSWTSPVALPAVPQPPAPPHEGGVRPLSLPELTEYALLNNPRTRQAWYAARAAAAAVGVERSDEFPQITASANLQRSQTGGQSGNQVDWITRYGPAITLSYLLYDFGVRANQARAAEFQAIAASLAQNRVLQEVVYQVEQSYYRLLGAEQLVQSNELFFKSVSTSLEATQRRREGGLATVADVYRAETQVAQAQLNLTRSRGELEKARGALASAVGLPVNATLRVQTLESEPSIRQISQSLTEILERAKTVRPDLVAAEAQVQSARAQAEAASKSGLPTLSLIGTSGRTFYRHDDPRNFTNTDSLLLGLSIPLFTGFDATYRARQAEARAAQAEAARDALFRQTELEVWQAYYDVQTASGGVRTTGVQLKAAEQTAAATLARYQAGFGSLLDLLTAQVDESNARVLRIQSFLDWFTAVGRLNLAIGASDSVIRTRRAR